QRTASLVVDAGHVGDAASGALERQRRVQREGLLGVYERGVVEVAERAPGAAAAEQVGERRQHLRRDAGAVLGGEFELGERVGLAGADRQRVEQHVRRAPGALGRLARRADDVVVEWHRASLPGGQGWRSESTRLPAAPNIIPTPWTKPTSTPGT